MSHPTEAQSIKFANIIHELQPETIVSGRVWNNKGDFRTLADNQVPSSTLDGAWQTPASIYHATWGYRNWQDRSDFSGKVKDLVTGLTSVRARGGNYLLNIGPRGDGSLVEFESDVLRDMGDWLNRHPKAILGASGTRFGGQSWGEITVNEQDLFLHIMNWPEDGQLVLNGLATDVMDVLEDGTANKLVWHYADNRLVITLPKKQFDLILPVIRVKLASDLFLIPEQTVQQSGDGKWLIDPENMYVGRGYADEGNYNSLVETTVRQTAYIFLAEAQNIYVEINGAVIDPDRLYKVEVGNESIQVVGDLLVKTKIGPFAVGGHDIMPVTITLANASHAHEDLGLTVEKIIVS